MASKWVNVAILEKDINGDVLSWYYPSLGFDEDALKYRSGLLDTELIGPAFRFSKTGSTWQYIYSSKLPVEEKKTHALTSVSVVVCSTKYNPEKHASLCELFFKIYLDSGFSSSSVMGAYLSVFTTNKVEHALGTFDGSRWDDRRALICPIMKVFELFGIEIILIWVAMLLKKRIFVYSNNVSDLLAVVRSLPAIGVWHRQDWSLIRPLCSLSEADFDDLSSAGYFIAGFTDAKCAQKTSMYDLFVDIPGRTVVTAEHAKQDFVLGKFHKQTANALLKAANDPNCTDQALIKAVALQSKELMGNLNSLKTDHDDGSYITMDELSQTKLPPNTDRFLFNVAKAEGMTGGGI